MADNFNAPQGQNQRQSVTTSMYTLWDNNGVQLRIAGMDNGLSIGLWIPFFSPEGGKKYPAENRYSVILNQRATIALEDIIYNHIVPAYDRGENAHMGVFTNNARTNMLEVEVRNGEFFINMHRDCDPTNRIPKNTITFKFDVITVADKFDRGTGEVEGVPIQADFFIFAKTIRAFNDLVGGLISAHGDRVAGDYRGRQLMDYIRAIATAVHAQLPAPAFQQRGGYSQQRQYGAQNNYNVDNAYQAQTLPPQPVTTEVNNLTDLIS